MARLCSTCGSGSKAKQCIECGKTITSGGVVARLCSTCGSGSKKDKCVKCGR